MNDHFNEQISEFMDDEMSMEESEFFVRRLQRDETARRQYLRYQLIGAAVRGEYRYPGGSELRQRLGEALENDAADSGHARTHWVQLAGGVGIAASVVFVAILGLRLIAPDTNASAAGAAGPATGAFVSETSTPASIIPAESTDQRALAGAPAVTGIQYLINHAQYTTGLNRTIVQSSVVAGRESDLVATGQEVSFE